MSKRFGRKQKRKMLEIKKELDLLGSAYVNVKGQGIPLTMGECFDINIYKQTSSLFLDKSSMVLRLKFEPSYLFLSRMVDVNAFMEFSEDPQKLDIFIEQIFNGLRYDTKVCLMRFKERISNSIEIKNKSSKIPW